MRPTPPPSLLERPWCARLVVWLGIKPAKVFDQTADNPGPSGLMAGPDAGAVVAMEVLVKQQVVVPIRITLKFFGTTVHRPTAAFVAQKNPNQAIGDLMRNLEQINQLARAGWILDFEIFP